MKLSRLATLRLLILTTLLWGLTAQASIVVRSTGSGASSSEASIQVEIDASGAASATTAPWSASGAVFQEGAFEASIQLGLDAIKDASVASGTLGDELVDGTVSWDGSGYLGVKDGPSSGGIGADGLNREGFQIRLDAMTGIESGLGVRISQISVQNVGREGIDPVGSESFIVVNLMTRESLEIVPAAGETGDFDVSGLGLVRASDDPGPVAAILSGATGGFRIDGLTLTVQEGTGAPVPVVESFATNDVAVGAGSTIRLDWSVHDADAISIAPSVGDVSAQPDGFALLSPLTSTTYTLTATNTAGATLSEVDVFVDATPATPEGPVGVAGIRYVSGELEFLDAPPASFREGASERYGAILLLPEKQGVQLSTPVEVDHLVDGPVTLIEADGVPGFLPQGVPLNSYLFHGDMPDDGPPSLLAATVTFEAPIVGLAYATETNPVSGFANRLEETDAVFGLDGMLFEDEDLAAESEKRRSVDGETRDEISISPDGLTLTVNFRLDGSITKNLDELRVITLALAKPIPAVAPNILFFLADDMGIGDTSAYQDWSGLSDAEQVATPELERLADLGLRLTDFHTQNRCTPTRYALLTGRYAWRAGLLKGVAGGTVSPPLIERERPTLPTFLKNLGYATGMVGKWHLGLEYRRSGHQTAADWEEADLRVPMRTTPLENGFDFFYGFSKSHLTSGPNGFNNNGPWQDRGPGWIAGRRIVGATGHGKELDGSYDLDEIGQPLLDQALGFLQSHMGNASSAQRPFFLYFASHANHGPYTPDDAINGIPVVGASKWKDGTMTGDTRRDFVYLNDVLLAQLMDYLEGTDDPRSPGAKLIDNTIVVFASDNGAELDDDRAVGNLRAYKARIYEGGHRVPFIVYWKNGGIGDGTEGDGGVSRDDLFAIQDFYPTIAEILVNPLEAPLTATDPAVDGFSLLSVLLDEECDPRPPILTNEQFGDTWLALQYKGTIPLDPVQTGYWKMIFDEPLLENAALSNGDAIPLELYNLGTDRLETTNLIGDPACADLVDYFSAWVERLVNRDGAREPVGLPELALLPGEAGSFGLQVETEPFFFYDIWASENLLDWERVETLQTPMPATVVEAFPVDRPKRFFRIDVRQ